MRDPGAETVADFGAQWQRYPDSEGYYGSLELLADICEPLLPVARLHGASVLEIGSGAGRIVDMLCVAGAAKVIAVEPSAAYEVLRRNTAQHGERVECLQAPGDAIPDRSVDFVLSIGVLHHVPDPTPIVRRAFELLAPGGQFLFWVYGREGNTAYLAFVQPLRRLARLLPDAVLGGLAHALNVPLTLYIALCRFLPLPLRDYARNVLGRFGWRQRSLVVFDQLNPRVARYYRAEEARALMAAGGFADIRLHHRRGYSWSVLGTRPGDRACATGRLPSSPAAAEP